jgi:hypothetical protein
LNKIFPIPLRRGVPNTTLCDKVCQWLATGRWFYPGTPVSSTNKTMVFMHIVCRTYFICTKIFCIIKRYNVIIYVYHKMLFNCLSIIYIVGN